MGEEGIHGWTATGSKGSLEVNSQRFEVRPVIIDAFMSNTPGIGHVGDRFIQYWGFVRHKGMCEGRERYGLNRKNDHSDGPWTLRWEWS